MKWSSTPCLFSSVGLKQGMRSSGKSSMIQSKSSIEGAWIPQTYGCWQVIFVRIVARLAMFMRRHLAMSTARSLVMKKSAARMGSITSAMWNSWEKEWPWPKGGKSFFCPMF